MGMFGNIMQAVHPQGQQGQPQSQQFVRSQPTQQQQPQGQPGMFGAVRQAIPQQQQQAQPRSGGMFGNVLGNAQSRFGAQPQQQMPQQGQMAGAMGRMGGMGGMLSDKRSKDRIRELEDLTDSYEALMGRDSGSKPELRQPDTDALDRAANYKNVGSYSYKYKDPNAPGASPGEHVGPMAHELRSIPGVVEQGPDGMDRVDGGRLSLANASAIGEHQRDIDELKDAHAALEKRRMMGALDDAGKRQSSRILSDNPY